MDQAEVFRQLVVNRYIPNGSYFDLEFSFDTVFRMSIPSYCCCPCAFEHEYFDYISDTGEIDVEMLERVAKNIADGKCPHTRDVPTGYQTRTSVYGSHIVAALAALGLEKMENKYLLDRAKGVFGLRPLDNAILKNNSIPIDPSILEVLNLLCRGSWSEKIVYISRLEGTKTLQVDWLSLQEACIKKRNIPMLKRIITTAQHTSVWITACELVLKDDLADMQKVLLKKTKDLYKRNWQVEYSYSVEKPSVTELAILHNNPDVLDQALKVIHLKKLKRFTSVSRFARALVETCYLLQRTECRKVLLKHGVTEPPGNMYDHMECLLRLLHSYKHSREEIKTAVKITISNNHDAIYKSILLLMYMWKDQYRSNADVQVIKILIDLGADIDKTDPPDDTILTDLLKSRKIPFEAFRVILELLLYENPSIVLNGLAVTLGLQYSDYLNKRWEQRCQMLAEQIVRKRIRPGHYLMDYQSHAHLSFDEVSALRFTAPLLIECGFPYSQAILEKALCDDNVIKHPAMKVYLQTCLTTPRSLKLCCRDSLRKHFKRRQIHDFVSTVRIPKTIKDFILLKSILHTV